MRASWTAQELLTTFEGEIDELVLVPGTGGIFDVHAGGERVWFARRDAIARHGLQAVPADRHSDA